MADGSRDVPAVDQGVPQRTLGHGGRRDVAFPVRPAGGGLRHRQGLARVPVGKANRLVGVLPNRRCQHVASVPADHPIVPTNSLNGGITRRTGVSVGQHKAE